MPEKKSIKEKFENMDFKGKEYLQRLNIFKSTADDAIKNAEMYDSNIITSNEEYINKLQEGDREEFEILKENMKKAESEEEREAIRTRMREMQDKRYEKDTENKVFYEKQQEVHNNNNMKILGAVAVAAGLVKFRKPLIEAGKAIIKKKV